MKSMNLNGKQIQICNILNLPTVIGQLCESFGLVQNIEQEETRKTIQDALTSATNSLLRLPMIDSELDTEFGLKFKNLSRFHGDDLLPLLEEHHHDVVDSNSGRTFLQYALDTERIRVQFGELYNFLERVKTTENSDEVTRACSILASFFDTIEAFADGRVASWMRDRFPNVTWKKLERYAVGFQRIQGIQRNREKKSSVKRIDKKTSVVGGGAKTNVTKCRTNGSKGVQSSKLVAKTNTKVVDVARQPRQRSSGGTKRVKSSTIGIGSNVESNGNDVGQQ